MFAVIKAAGWPIWPLLIASIVALALIVENGGWGASVAAPIARKVFDYWLSPDRAAARKINTAAPAEAAHEEGVGESPDAVVKPEDLPEEPD